MRAALHHLLEERAHTHEGDAALTYGGDTRQLRRALGHGRTVRSRPGGARCPERDDRVAVYLEKRIETVESICGASAAGGVFVPINPLLKPQQVAYILDDCGVRVLVTTAAAPRAAGAEQLAACPTVERVVVVDDDASRDGGHERATPLVDRGDFARAGAVSTPRRSRHGGDPLHVRQHRQAEGRRADPPQPDRRRRRASASTSTTRPTT